MKTKISKEQFKKEIIKHFKTVSGMKISEAKEKIKKQLLKDEYDSDIIATNVKLFYTNNPNYCSGKKNGFGKGWYISNIGFTGGGQIKLSEKY